MWWTEFERRLNMAFATMNAVERRQTFSESMKLHLLLQKIRCNWLGNVSAIINIELSRADLNYTYDEAMTAFRNKVMKKNSSAPYVQNLRRVKETHSKRNQHTNDSSKGKKGHPDEIMITLKNGKKIKYHASYKFDDETYRLFTSEQRQMLYNQRKEYRLNGSKNGKPNNSHRESPSVQNLQREVEEMRTVAKLQRELDELKSTMSQYNVPTHVSTTRETAAMSQVSTSQSRAGRSIMGGQSEQEALRRGRNSRRSFSRSRSCTP